MKIYISLISCFIPLFLLAQSPRFAPGYPEKGLEKMPLGIGKAELYNGAVQADGKILICGSIRREASVNNPAGFVYSDRNFLLIRHLPNGNPDSSFGTAGIISLDHRDQSEFFYDINLDQAGNIFLLGGGNFSTYVVKFFPDGKLDTNFGNKGFLQVDEGLSDRKIRDLHLLPDGKMLFCGAEEEDFLLLQFKADGTPDLQFGEQGAVLFSLGNSGYPDDALTLALQDNGRILVGGTTDNTPTVLAYSPDGKLDTSFNHKGYIQLESPDHQGRFEQIHIFPDQSFIAVGAKFSENKNAQFAAFQADGQLDTTRFGKAVIEPATAQEQNFRFMAVSPKEEIFYQSFFDKKFLLTKLTPQGVLDSTFGFEGQVIFTIENQPCFGNNVMLQPSGKILMSGSCLPGYAVVCLDSMGRLDASFQQTGFFARKIEDGGSAIWHLHRMKDHSLVGIGHSYHWQAKSNGADGISVPQGHIWKYDSQGGLQFDFALPLVPGGRRMADLKEAKNGDYLVAGDNIAPNGFTEDNEPFIMKMSSDGLPDLTFGDQGTVFLKKLFPDSTINPFNMQKIHEGPDQKIWVVFQEGVDIFIQNAAPPTTIVARLLPNGKLDAGFQGKGYIRLYETGVIEVTETLLLEDQHFLVGGYVNINRNVPGFSVAQVFENEPFNPYKGRTNGIGFSNERLIAGGKIIQKPNGEILQGGSVSGDFILLQYLSDGQLNEGFANWGIVRQEFPFGSITFSDMALAPNGDVLLLGFVDNWNAGRYDGIIACFDEFGLLKPEFGDQGIYSFQLGTSYNYAETISMDSLGNFAVSGSAGGEAFTMQFLSDLHLDDPSNMPPNSMEKPIVFPNPVQNQTVKVRYTLPSDQLVTIRLLDIQGRICQTLFDEQQLAGTHTRLLRFPYQGPTDWGNPYATLGAGFYIVHIQTGAVSNYVKIQVLPD